MSLSANFEEIADRVATLREMPALIGRAGFWLLDDALELISYVELLRAENMLQSAALRAAGLDPAEPRFGRPGFDELARTFVRNVHSLETDDPERASIADEGEIRTLVRSAAKSQVWLAPPYKIAKLLDGARLLARHLDREREKVKQLETSYGLLFVENQLFVSFVIAAERRAWITRYERDVLLGLRDDRETLDRLLHGDV